MPEPSFTTVSLEINEQNASDNNHDRCNNERNDSEIFDGRRIDNHAQEYYGYATRST